MSEAVLVALIHAACATFTGEDRIACYENVTNCAVGAGGVIKEEKAIKCAKEKATNEQKN